VRRALQIVVATGFVAAFLPAYGNYSLKLFDDIARGARTLKPLYLRATGAIHPESQELIEERARLQAKVRTMINTLGPTIFPDFAEIRLIKPEEFEQEAQLLARIRRHSMTQDLPADDDGADDDIDLAQDDDADVLQD
jgi:anthranilate phosphoribosyltransferase